MNVTERYLSTKLNLDSGSLSLVVKTISSSSLLQKVRPYAYETNILAKLTIKAKNLKKRIIEVQNEIVRLISVHDTTYGVSRDEFVNIQNQPNLRISSLYAFRLALNSNRLID